MSSLNISLIKTTRHSLLFLFCLLFIYIPLEARGTTVSEVEIHGLSSIEKEELLDLLCFKPGNPIDDERVRQGIKRAFLKGIFEDISVETTDEEKTKVIIYVKERDYIEKVSVEGEYDLSGRFIKNSFPLKEGHVMRYDMINDAIEKLRYEITRRGYPNSRINVKIERLKEPYRVNLYLQILIGEPARIKKIIIPGGTVEIERMISLSEGDIYDQVKLGKDIEKIKTYYKKNGYVKAAVGPYTFVDGTLTLPFNPGKRLKISIEGNRAISTKTLSKEMPFFEAGDFNNSLVEEAVNKMLSLYRQKGYPFSQIAPVISSENDLESLTFFVFEGKKVEVRAIHFGGVSLPDKNLKEIMSLKEGGLYNPDLIDADRVRILEFYHALGYLTANIEEFQTIPPYPPLLKGGKGGLPEKMDIYIKVHEGTKTEIANVDIEYPHLISKDEVRAVIRIKPGDPYNKINILDTCDRIIQLYSSHGFIDVVVSVKRDFEGQKAYITFQILEGYMTNFGKTIVSGNSGARHKVITDRVVAFVDNTAITLSEFEDVYSNSLMATPGITKEEVLDTMVNRLLLIRKANRPRLEASSEDELLEEYIDLNLRPFIKKQLN
jgi:outer membrane protein assembly factor BamA